VRDLMHYLRRMEQTCRWLGVPMTMLGILVLTPTEASAATIM